MGNLQLQRVAGRCSQSERGQIVRRRGKKEAEQEYKMIEGARKPRCGSCKQLAHRTRNDPSYTSHELRNGFDVLLTIDQAKWPPNGSVKQIPG